MSQRLLESQLQACSYGATCATQSLPVGICDAVSLTGKSSPALLRGLRVGLILQASVFTCFTVKAKAGDLTPFGVRNSVIAMAALPSPDLTAQLLNLINLHRCLPARYATFPAKLQAQLPWMYRGGEHGCGNKSSLEPFHVAPVCLSVQYLCTHESLC